MIMNVLQSLNQDCFEFVSGFKYARVLNIR